MKIEDEKTKQNDFKKQKCIKIYIGKRKFMADIMKVW